MITERDWIPAWTSASWWESRRPVRWWESRLDDLGPVTLDRPVGKLATMAVQVDDATLDILLGGQIRIPSRSGWTTLLDADGVHVEPPSPPRHRAEATVSDQSAGAKITGTTS